MTPSNVEILWRDEFIEPAGAGDDGEIGFFDHYHGGVQELFPNAGPLTTVEGASLPFHGEACRARWAAEPVDDDGGALSLTVNLRRYPFRLDRQIGLLSDRAGVRIRSKVTNLSSRQRPVHWGLHPVFSENLTAGGELYGGFSKGTADGRPFGLAQTYVPGQELPVDSDIGVGRLRLIDGHAGTSDLSYLEATEGWFVISGESGYSAAVVWPVELFPKIWLWQECRGQTAYPWWGRHHLVGVEPHTSAPLLALEEEITQGTSLLVAPGQSVEAEFLILAESTGVERFVHDVSMLARSNVAGVRT